MSSRKCPDCLNPIKVCRELGGCGRGEAIEAHGVKGLHSTPWVKTFADRYALASWAERNGAEVYGTRKPTEGRPVSIELVEAVSISRARSAARARRNAARQERLHAELGESRFGTPEPQIKLTASRDEHHRAIGAELHQLAAAVELATMKTDARWCVTLERDSDYTGRILVELVDGDAAEAERAMAILTAVVRSAHLAQAKAVHS